jgi:hypothetical protein
VANTGIISAHRRLRQDNPKFKARLGNIARPCLKKKKVLEGVILQKFSEL